MEASQPASQPPAADKANKPAVRVGGEAWGVKSRAGFGLSTGISDGLLWSSGIASVPMGVDGTPTEALHRESGEKGP